jgi:catechol 2,3-dioxygenase-like lactoylglutathione lyase family enzyme
MPNGPALLLAFDHVQLAMPANAENDARAFYQGLLGLTEVAKPAALAMRGGVWFETGCVRVHLGVEAPFSPARKAHPAFRVADLGRLEALLGTAGSAVLCDRLIPGRDRFYTNDPFGNRLEFIQDN